MPAQLDSDRTELLGVLGRLLRAIQADWDDGARRAFLELTAILERMFPGIPIEPIGDIGSSADGAGRMTRLPWPSLIAGLERETEDQPGHAVAAELYACALWLSELAEHPKNDGERENRDFRGPTASLGSPEGTEARKTTLKDQRDYVRTYLAPGFTPVLGAGVQQVAADLDIIRWDDQIRGFGPPPPRKEPGGANWNYNDEKPTRDEDFAKDLAIARRDGRTIIPEMENSKAITHLRKSLLELVHAYHITVLRLLPEKARPSFWTGESAEISLSFSAAVADRQPRAEPRKQAGAETTPKALILERLGTALEAIQHDVCRTWVELGAQAIESGLTAIQTDVRKEVVSTDSLAWLCDVFWHTMIFNSGQCTLRMDELAFQVRLVLDSKVNLEYLVPKRRLNPTNRIARRIEPHYVESLNEAFARITQGGNRGWDRVGPGVHDGRRELLQALAKRMHHQFEAWRTARLPSANAHRDLLQQLKGPRSDGGPFVSMIVSMTSDCLLEQALLAQSKTFHVIAPFFLKPNGDNCRAELGWFAATVAPGQSLDDPTWIRASTFEVDDIDGPVVVRANGAIFTSEPQWSDLPATAAEPMKLLPLVPLGEFEFLQYLNIEQFLFVRGILTNQRTEDDGVLPRWLTEELKKPKRQWFWLGTRLSDWDSRTAFFLWFLRTGQGVTRHHSIVKKIDPDRRPLFQALDVTVVESDLRELTEFLNH